MDCTRAQQQPAQEGKKGEYSLTDLLHGVVYTVLGTKQPLGVRVSGVAVDSRKVRAGSLFVALAGSRTDGHAYLDQVTTHDRAVAAALSRPVRRLRGSGCGRGQGGPGAVC